jgi:hypothetical protein
MRAWISLDLILIAACREEAVPGPGQTTPPPPARFFDSAGYCRGSQDSTVPVWEGCAESLAQTMAYWTGAAGT